MTAKTRTPSPAPNDSAFVRRADVGRQITSERISEHLAAFVASGGIVERLGNTPISRTLRPEPTGAKPKAPVA